MNPDPEPDPDPALDRALRALPDRAAPATLIPSVLTALAARQQPAWWQRSWFEWTPALRFWSASVALLLLGGLVRAASAGALTWPTFTAPDPMRDIGALLGTLGETIALALNPLPSGLLLATTVMILTAYATCLALGTVCWRLVLRRS